MEKGRMQKRCDPKWIAGKAGVSARGGGVLWLLALIFAILGIIADAMNGTLGLEPISWFLLAIAAFVASLSYYIAWAMGVYFRAIEAKSKKEA